MKDLGEKSGEPISDMPKKWYPNVTVDAADFVSLKEKSLGKECVVTMKVRKTGERITKGGDGKISHKIDLELRGMELPKKQPTSIEHASRMMREEYK